MYPFSSERTRQQVWFLSSMNFPLNPLIITTPPRILWLAMFTKVARHGRFKKRQYGGVRPVMRVPPNPPKLDYVNWDILKAMGIPHDFGNPDVAIVLSRHVSPALWQQQGQQSEDYAGEIKDGVPVSGQWKSQNPRKFVFFSQGWYTQIIQVI